MKTEVELDCAGGKFTAVQTNIIHDKDLTTYTYQIGSGEVFHVEVTKDGINLVDVDGELVVFSIEGNEFEYLFPLVQNHMPHKVEKKEEEREIIGIVKDGVNYYVGEYYNKIFIKSITYTNCKDYLDISLADDSTITIYRPHMVHTKSRKT